MSSDPGPLPPIPNNPEIIAAMAADPEIRALRGRLFSLLSRYRYPYNWTWFGRPIIQLPDDLMAMQMLILHHKPDVIVETGIAHGGSLIFYASLMEMLGHGRVIGVDIDIRAHNREALEAHPLFKRLTLIEGSSVDDAIAAEVRERVGQARCVFVCLDSNHTDAHVRLELELYSRLVTPGAYLVVFDTVIEDQAAEDFPDRPWGPGDNPKTAVHAFLETHEEFSIDRELEARLFLSVAPDGYLRRAP